MIQRIWIGLGVISLFSAALPAQTKFTNFDRVIIPSSNATPAVDGTGKRWMHTNLRYLVPSTVGITPQVGGPPILGLFYETPASIACVYGLVRQRAGCNPNVVTQNPTGGGGAIAIVDAFDNPTAQADLDAFSDQFGLPRTTIQVVYAGGAQPAQDPSGGWEIEESLDVQWAHAMAPQATIYLVEADSNNTSDLITALQQASSLVAGAGGGEVSMSWGGGEFSEETTLEGLFQTAKVVYFASAGDGPGTIWPSVSVNVVSAGGTSLSRDLNTGTFLLENAWQDGGGGISAYEARPWFQEGIRRIVGPMRGTPDQSFDSNPNTGVWVLATSGAGGAPAGWYIVGGTSVASPSLAGMANARGAFHGSSQAENAADYRNARSGFRDIEYGNCGVYMASFTGDGWDLCTGLGSPVGSHHH